MCHSQLRSSCIEVLLAIEPRTVARCRTVQRSYLIRLLSTTLPSHSSAMSASSASSSDDLLPGSNSSGSLSSVLSAASSEFTSAKHDPNYFAAAEVWSKYHQVRPVYPSSLFDLIFEYHRKKPAARFDLAADFGSGPGTIVPELLRAFKRVEASGERLLSGCDLPSPPLTLMLSLRAHSQI